MVPPIQKYYDSSSVTYISGYEEKKPKRTKSSKKTSSSEEKNQTGMSRNAARERYRVKSLRNAFQNLQKCLPSVPPNTKLSKLDVLILATTYISHLSRILTEDDLSHENCFSTNDFIQADTTCSFPVVEADVRSPSWEKSYLHPVKKWPMRSRLYAGVEDKDATVKDCILSSGLSRRQWL